MINQTQDTRELHNAAIRLWEDGFSVIPLCPRQKRPAVEWTKYQRERCDIIDINRWWPISAGSASSHVLPYGLGIVTGRVSHDVTLDFDPAQGSTVEALLAEAEAHFGSTFPETCRVLTVTYGWHDHYRIGANASVSAVPTRLFFTGKHGKIELRADGAVAVMPPTIAVPKTGMGVVSPGTFRQYTYLRGLDRRLDWESTWMATAASAAVVAAVGATAACSGVADLEKPPTQAEIQAAVAMVRPYLTADCVCVLDGSRMCDDRSAQSYWLACELVRTAKSHDLDWSPRVIACVVMAAPCHIEKYGKRHGGWDAWTDAVNCVKKAEASASASASASAACESEAQVCSRQPQTTGTGTGTGKFVRISLAELEPYFREPQFLIYPLLPRGELVIVDGDPDAGKSWVCFALSAGLTGSKVCPIPYDHTARNDCHVVILTAEDDPFDTIGPRMRKLGANMARVDIIGKREGRAGDPCGDAEVTAADLEDAMPLILAQPTPDLIVVDPIVLFASSEKEFDSNRGESVRGMLNKLKSIARKLNCVILVVRHFRKTGGKALYRGAGSIDYVGTGRSVLQVCLDKTGADGVGGVKRVLTHIKSNKAPKMDEGIYFTLDKNACVPFAWAEIKQVDPDALTDDPANARATEQKAKYRLAEEVLLDLLGDGEEVPREDIFKHMKKNGIMEDPIYKAKDRLGVLSRQVGFGKGKTSYWFLPKKDPCV